jgi:deazaflavin-dependent oxidoreductase (nitroreductase family)
VTEPVEETLMTHATPELSQKPDLIDRAPNDAPAVVHWSNPIARAALRLGLPAGPNVLMTVRGRKSGQPRTAPVAAIEIDGARYLLGAYGDVQWVRNLRAAGVADLRLHRQERHFISRELDHDAAVTFYRRTLPDYIAAFPWFGRAFARAFFSVIGSELVNDPDRAAELHPVFELRPA